MSALPGIDNFGKGWSASLSFATPSFASPSFALPPTTASDFAAPAFDAAASAAGAGSRGAAPVNGGGDFAIGLGSATAAGNAGCDATFGGNGIVADGTPAGGTLDGDAAGADDNGAGIVAL